jgi:hypothetical protein
VGATVRLEGTNPDRAVRIGEEYSELDTQVAARDSTTDEKGTFSFAALPGGAFVVRPLLRRADRHEFDLQLADGEDRADLELVIPRKRSIRGRVVDSRGAPARFAHVEAYAERTPLVRRGDWVSDGQSNADGEFVIDGLEAGSYAVLATMDPEWNVHLLDEDAVPFAFERNVEVDSAESADYDALVLTLGRARHVVGIVLDANGMPVENAAVNVDRYFGDWTTNQNGTRTNASGRFRIRVPAGKEVDLIALYFRPSGEDVVGRLRSLSPSANDVCIRLEGAR